MELENRTLDDMLALQLNRFVLTEVNNIDITYSLALEAVEEHIRSLILPNGRKLRSERVESMIQVYRALFHFMDKKDGQCSPSMETIAIYLNPEISGNPKAITAGKVKVWRTVNALRDFGLIETHIYRAETNRLEEENAKRMPNFFYELKPISKYSEFFASLIMEAIGVAKNIAVTIANTIDILNPIKREIFASLVEEDCKPDNIRIMESLRRRRLNYANRIEQNL